MRITGVFVDGDADLPEIVQTDRPARRSACLADNGQENGHQNCNDADDDQKFDQRKTPASGSPGFAVKIDGRLIHSSLQI